jgi:hypothetical protein
MRFRLRTLLIVISVLGIWLGLQANRVNRQRRAVAALNAARAKFGYDYERDNALNFIPNATPPAPKWLRSVVGDDYFRRVTLVDFCFGYRDRQRRVFPPIADADLQCLLLLPDIRILDIGHAEITDAGLANLRNLKQLRLLYLYHTKVSGSGLSHLQSLPSLAHLDLKGAPLTPAGCQQLGRLSHLVTLGLEDTPITDDDLQSLLTLTNLKSLTLGNTAITDAGLPHLARLTTLENLDLPPAISDEGMVTIRASLPNCVVGGPRREK